MSIATDRQQLPTAHAAAQENEQDDRDQQRGGQQVGEYSGAGDPECYEFRGCLTSAPVGI